MKNEISISVERDIGQFLIVSDKLYPGFGF